MLKFASLTAAAVALSVSGANADGMSWKDGPSSYNWVGLYFGGTIGYGWGYSQTWFNNNGGSGPDGAHPYTNNDPSGALGGVTAGYNYQVGDKWVAGIEADISMADIKGNDGMLWGDGHRWHTGWDGLITVRGRAGYELGSRTLVYGTAGIAAVDSSEYNIGDEVKNDDQSSDNTGWRWGWVAGLGVERAFSDRWTGKIEYLHVGMADNNGHGIKNNGRSTYGYSNDLDIIRVGVNYKMN